MSETVNLHYDTLIRALMDGRVIPFLGAGANMCGRPEGVRWDANKSDYLPNGSELAEYLANRLGGPEGETRDLLRVSEYITVMAGLGPLYEELHKLFDRDYPFTSLHQFLADLPGVLRKKGYPPRYQLIVTTNYDDVLERAFQAAGEPFDLVTYVAEGEQRGKFMHWPPDAEARLIERPNEYRDLSFDRRTVILKIHGAVDRAERDRDSFVITEDHYIDYLTRTDVANLVPVTLVAKLRKSSFLFLGYGLRDWNLRVILHRISSEQRLNFKSWAIQCRPPRLDEEFWKRRGVDIFNLRLEEYIAGLNERLEALPPAPHPAAETAHA